MKFLLALFFLFVPGAALAQSGSSIVIDLAEDHVDVTSSFNGRTVTVFGSTDQDGDIAIVLKGPENRVVMRKKQSSMGMWLNGEAVDFKRVPLFYSYAVSRPENRIASPDTLRRYGVGLNALSFDAANYDDDTNIAEYQEALIRTQQAHGFFPLLPSQIRFLGQRLFRTSFYLPGNVPVGNYRVEAYLFREGELIDRNVIGLDVAQAGMSGSILNFAVDYSFTYALFGLLMAISAGIAAFWMSRSQRV